MIDSHNLKPVATTLRNIKKDRIVGYKKRSNVKNFKHAIHPVVMELTECERTSYGMNKKSDEQLILHREVLMCRILRSTCKCAITEDVMLNKSYVLLVRIYREELLFLESELFMRGYSFDRNSSVISMKIEKYLEKKV